MSMRRRAVHRPEADELEQPLLGPQGEAGPVEDDEQYHGHPPGTSHGQIIVYNAFDLKHFIVGIVQKCAGTLSSFWQLLQTCYASLTTWAGVQQPVNLSLIQEERLEKLWVSLGQPFSLDEPDHRQALRDLWVYAFPGEPCTTLKSERWKDAGWQGDDPSTDIRGAGYFGVLNLLYLARTYPSEFDRLLHKRSGQRSEWEYPFAAAGINLTFTLAELLGLKRGAHSGGAAGASWGLPLEHMKKQPAFAGFVSLLGEEPCAFEELYVVAFKTLDDRWLKAGASYMQFNSVIKDVMADITKALRAGPNSFEHLAILLGV